MENQNCDIKAIPAIKALPPLPLVPKDRVATITTASTNDTVTIEPISDMNYSPLQSLFLASRRWQVKPMCQEDLLITNNHEYYVVSEFRKTLSAQTDLLTKQFVDDILTKQNELFDTRNLGKKENKEHKEKKSFFSRNKK